MYQRAYHIIYCGLHHIIRKGYVYPTNTTGGPWKPKGNKGGTNSIEQPWTLTLFNCIRYNMLTWELPFLAIQDKIKLEATSWEVYLWVILLSFKQITYKDKKLSPLEKA